ncbi:Asp-tRNA(Asn)/Glu-tRNA(Gln) amidotransferase subunit GatB [Desulfotomaculum copahuensis]|uniref:Aspartyl/glutamyl-tRNA(Asn/Gln) amidotransferase subunit B n=1 Tax=Desulfotomaculum copahuensis TaxID=1838280 RepID=A0A1B7LGW4_9FIRM|nr:Asp-tRNA(Asn)/Glu-tRNA(Gln) amidotransferase subunit GatB [Desulfotomaculum copahuensis]OAT85432.1 aspartyl/glutamyl-tRNA amidotransferase subunit B [Desulfotomaculum copahuensis]
MADYETIIGLEVHVELKTNSKIFCPSTTEFGAGPNTHVCPVCLGLPGTLPVLNKKVLAYAIKAALALNCQIAEYSKFDRKNYYYPDLPKNYQISQYDLPIAEHGHLDIEVDGREKRIGITRLHMEEDAGKLVHQGNITTSPYSLVDYNRTGVPLIEIVSEPDMRSPEEARAYLDKLKAIIAYTGVSDCKMEEGSLRCDANISVRPRGTKEFGTKSEIKNMNSFRALQRALAYEVERQIAVLEDGGRIVQETRTWDEARGETRSMRSKEEAHDYRYFPEPDLVPLVIDRQWVEEIRATLPELPDQRRQRYMRLYDLPSYDAAVLTSSLEMAEYYEACVAMYPNAKAVSNWMMGDLSRLLNAANMDITACRVRPDNLTGMLKLIDQGTISGKIAKTVFEEMFNTGKDAAQVVKEKGLVQISDAGAITAVIDQVLAGNPKVVEDYRAGKDKALGFLVGQVMKTTRGKANPELVNKLLREKLQA